MDAYAGVLICATTKAPPEYDLQGCLPTPQQPADRHDYDFSLVGYDTPEKLHAAIREHHVRTTGRPLALVANFGGHLPIATEALSALPLSLSPDSVDHGTFHGEIKDVVQDALSAEAYEFVVRSYNGAEPSHDSSRGAHALPQGIKESVPDPDNDESIYRAVLAASPQKMETLLESLNLTWGDCDRHKGVDNFIRTIVIPRIRLSRLSRALSSYKQRKSAGQLDTVREAEASHRIQLFRSRVTAALAKHHAETKLSREALQTAGALPPASASLAAFSITLLQGVLDYLDDNKQLLDTVARATINNVGGPSSHRMLTINRDPDAEVAAIIRSEGSNIYTANRFERFLCLVPLGSAVVSKTVAYYRPSGNAVIEEMAAKMRSLSFIDSAQRLAVAPGYAQLSQFIAWTTRRGMSFNVAAIYEHLARAMAVSSHAAADSGEWRKLCSVVMQTSRTQPVNTAMQRDILD